MFLGGLMGSTGIWQKLRQRKTIFGPIRRAYGESASSRYRQQAVRELGLLQLLIRKQELLPDVRESLRGGLHVRTLFDQEQ